MAPPPCASPLHPIRPSSKIPFTHGAPPQRELIRKRFSGDPVVSGRVDRGAGNNAGSPIQALTGFRGTAN